MTAQAQCLDWPQYITVHFTTHTQIQSPDAWRCLSSREEKTWAVMTILIGKEVEYNAEVKKRCGDQCCCLGIISLAATPRKRQKTANENATSIHKIWLIQTNGKNRRSMISPTFFKLHFQTVCQKVGINFKRLKCQKEFKHFSEKRVNWYKLFQNSLPMIGYLHFKRISKNWQKGSKHSSSLSKLVIKDGVWLKPFF